MNKVKNIFNSSCKITLKLTIIIVLSLFMLGCSQKIVVNKPYLVTQNKIQKILDERHLKLNNITNENKNSITLKLKESEMPRFHIINESSSRWLIFEGRPFNKQDALMPKYTQIYIKSKSPKQTLIKIDSFDQGLLIRSRVPYRQEDWLNQIINALNEIN
jgi:hypothetical protein